MPSAHAAPKAKLGHLTEEELKCKSRCLGYHQVSWMLWVNLSFVLEYFYYSAVGCVAIKLVPVFVHLFAPALQEEQCGYCRCLLLGAQPPTCCWAWLEKSLHWKRMSRGQPWNQLVLLHSWAHGTFASHFCAQHNAGAASLPPQHPASAGSSYAGEDWLYWPGLVILVRTPTCAGAACPLCIVVISPTGKYNQWEHSFKAPLSLHR